MKKGIHPDYHEITVEMVDGTKFKTRSTYGKEGANLKLDIDPSTHPAWTGGTKFLNENVSKVAEFKKKFSGVNFMAQKTSDKEEDKKDN
ncbi:MAG: 50S ribosomal protein L31 [Rickettsiales bacterium]|nr:50S ribosomal protein L31 [Rickettsiales bacterium]